MATYWGPASALALSLSVVTGCAGPSITGLISGEDIVVEDGGSTLTYTDEESGLKISSGQGAEVPDLFPSDFPIPQSATIVSAAENEGYVLLIIEWEGMSRDDFLAYVATAQAAGYSETVEIMDLDLGGGAYNTAVSLSNGTWEVLVSVLGDSENYGQLSVTAGPPSN